jgi:hypothetical protein
MMKRMMMRRKRKRRRAQPRPRHRPTATTRSTAKERVMSKIQIQIDLLYPLHTCTFTDHPQVSFQSHTRDIPSSHLLQIMHGRLSPRRVLVKVGVHQTLQRAQCRGARALPMRPAEIEQRAGQRAVVAEEELALARAEYDWVNGRVDGRSGECREAEASGGWHTEKNRTAYSINIQS